MGPRIHPDPRYAHAPLPALTGTESLRELERLASLYVDVVARGYSLACAMSAGEVGPGVGVMGEGEARREALGRMGEDERNVYLQWERGEVELRELPNVGYEADAQKQAQRERLRLEALKRIYRRSDLLPAHLPIFHSLHPHLSPLLRAHSRIILLLSPSPSLPTPPQRPLQPFTEYRALARVLARLDARLEELLREFAERVRSVREGREALRRRKEEIGGEGEVGLRRMRSDPGMRRGSGQGHAAWMSLSGAVQDLLSPLRSPPHSHSPVPAPPPTQDLPQPSHAPLRSASADSLSRPVPPSVFAPPPSPQLRVRRGPSAPAHSPSSPAPPSPRASRNRSPTATRRSSTRDLTSLHPKHLSSIPPAAVRERVPSHRSSTPDLTSLHPRHISSGISYFHPWAAHTHARTPSRRSSTPDITSLHPKQPVPSEPDLPWGASVHHSPEPGPSPSPSAGAFMDAASSSASWGSTRTRRRRSLRPFAAAPHVPIAAPAAVPPPASGAPAAAATGLGHVFLSVRDSMSLMRLRGRRPGRASRDPPGGTVEARQPEAEGGESDGIRGEVERQGRGSAGWLVRAWRRSSRSSRGRAAGGAGWI